MTGALVGPGQGANRRVKPGGGVAGNLVLCSWILPFGRCLALSDLLRAPGPNRMCVSGIAHSGYRAFGEARRRGGREKGGWSNLRCRGVIRGLRRCSEHWDKGERLEYIQSWSGDSLVPSRSLEIAEPLAGEEGKGRICLDALTSVR